MVAIDYEDRFLYLFVAISVAPVIVSYLVEALRTVPKEPKQLSWAPNIPIQHLEIDGVNLRFIKTGTGEPLILLHTLRTQLDMFQKMTTIDQCFDPCILDSIFCIQSLALC